jgi:PAS domain S-box-containing protein
MMELRQLLVLLCAEAALGLLFWLVYRNLSRLYPRPHLAHWTQAWTLLLCHVAVAFVDGAVADTYGRASMARVPTSTLYGLTSNLGLLALALGVGEFVTQRAASTRTIRRLATLGFVVAATAGIAPVAFALPDAWASACPEGPRAVFAAVVACGALLSTWRTPRTTSATPGTVIMRVGLAALALVQGYAAVLSNGPNASGWTAEQTILDLIVWTTLGIGAVTWVFEREHGRLEELTRARRALETDLTLREKRFEAIVSGLWELVFLLDARGRITFMSRPQSEVMGYSADDVVGQPFEAFVDPDDAAEAARAFQVVLARPNAMASVTCRMTTKQRESKHILCVARNLLHEPSIGGVLVTTLDVTERVALEAQLRDAQRLESIGRLAGGIAHDFNNLLTIILGHADLGRDAVRRQAAGDAEFSHIQMAAERAATLTQQLLSFAQRQVMEPRTLDINALLASVEDMLRRLAGGHIEMALALAPQPLYVRSDPGQIQQLALNLVANARDAMPEGGRLTLSTQTRVVSSHDGAALGIEPGAYVTFSIADTGAGISDDVKPHVFEPFFTTKEISQGTGTGLGLASSYGIARQHGGTIVLDTRPGTGSTFTVYLPAVAATSLIPEPPQSQGRADGQELVLFVEDDPTVREIGVLMLRQQGFEVVKACDGVEALAVLDATPSVQCVVSDVIMPRLGGLSLAQQIRARYPHMPVVLTSGYTDRASIAQILDTRTDFLQKPYTAASLGDHVRRGIDVAVAARHDQRD